jgi:protein-L-isoaspartate(D-aspartate) O-methyltransferase|tara:strand:- start:9916 stop:10524 length:609 start_codon:yes stop_codon:yes gene_type:complete
MAHIRDMKEMIKIIKTYDESISDRVLQAVQQVPRHKFIKEKGAGYLDTPLPIGFGQTISQPFIVAYMTDKLNIKPLDKVLEIGTGSGYQAAILAEMAYDIYSVERIFKLSQKTEKLLRQLGYVNIKLKVGDGYKGWKENAPYDRIIVTAMSNEIPQELIKQLNVGGKMIIPYKGKLELITKTKTSYDQESLTGVAFVPLVKG